jgi:hypothetical protein
MKQIKEIIEGWGRLAQDKIMGVDTDMRKLADSRLNVCETCPVRSYNRCDPRKEGPHVKTGKITKGCGCILGAKVLAATAECPLGKW